MIRALPLLMAAALAALAAEPTEKELGAKPVTTLRGELGDLLRGWYKHDMAAGNIGDWYDNRDRDHSPLDLALFPQLRKVSYTDEERQSRRDWAAQDRVLGHVVFGNSSTSAPPELSGSNPRSLYTHPRGLPLLEQQYRKNNLYIYPEHRDHDPGHNGQGGGYGDLFPTNTPYLIISQGSSGSDGLFLRAVATTLASFRPDVKKKLVETGLLMPTVQMILRKSNSHLKRPEEYLTGKAHPTAFEDRWLDPMKMARLAQSIRTVTIPPLVRLKVVEETVTEPGRDFFDRPGVTEQHADTESVIARTWRGHQRTRRLVVSASNSLDVNKAPLKFTWALLRGDPKRVNIKPRGKAEDEAEITVTYHERRPIAPGAALESNRVDIGVFAHNGTYHSAPAFVTFFSLDSEWRTYDEKGRALEIGYGMGATDLSLSDPAGALAELGKDGLAAKMLGLTQGQREELAQVAKLAAVRGADLAEARRARAGAEGAFDKARNRYQQVAKEVAQGTALLRQRDQAAEEMAWRQSVLRKADDALARAQADWDRLLDSKREPLGVGARPFVLGKLREAARRPTLWNDHQSALSALAGKAPRVTAARRLLVQLGIVAERPDKKLTLKPIRSGPAGKEVERLTGHERAMLEYYHATLLVEVVLPGKVAGRFVSNFVDARLTVVKPWRDVYRYEGDRLTGWMRYHVSDKPLITEHTAEGWWVVGRDAKARPTKARPMTYGQGPPRKGAWINDGPLRMAPLPELITIGYEGDKRVIKREKMGKK